VKTSSNNGEAEYGPQSVVDLQKKPHGVLELFCGDVSRGCRA
jgi:hypothetical protein